MQEQSTLLTKIAESADENGISLLYGKNMFDFEKPKKKFEIMDQKLKLQDQKVWFSDGAAQLFGHRLNLQSS